jgi:hypothetical protein
VRVCGFRDGLRICVCVWVCSLVVCIGREVVAFYLRHEVGFKDAFEAASWLCCERFGFCCLRQRVGWPFLLLLSGVGGEGRIWSERLAGELS